MFRDGCGRADLKGSSNTRKRYLFFAIFIPVLPTPIQQNTEIIVHRPPQRCCSNRCKSLSPHKTRSCTKFLVRQVGRPLSHQLQPRRLLYPAAGYRTHPGGILQGNCRDDLRHFPGIGGRTKDLGGSSNTVGGTQHGI